MYLADFILSHILRIIFFGIMVYISMYPERFCNYKQDLWWVARWWGTIVYLLKRGGFCGKRWWGALLARVISLLISPFLPVLYRADKVSFCSSTIFLCRIILLETDWLWTKTVNQVKPLLCSCGVRCRVSAAREWLRHRAFNFHTVLNWANCLHVIACDIQQIFLP